MNTVKDTALLTVSQRLAETLAIALAYVSTAALGFVVAIPPGNVTPVWPPSGLALAAVLVVGYRSGVGIWLGSFAANAWFFTHSIALSAPTTVVNASSIATGSTLQALLAAFLIKRLVGTTSLDRLNDALKFLGVAAVTCFAASSWGVTTLVLADLVAWGTYPYTWFTWWLGDFAGILVVTPSLLVLSGGAYTKQLSRKMTFPLLGFGSGLTLIAFFVLWQIERQAVEADLNAAHSVWPWGFLLAGLAFTALLAIYIETHRREATLLAAHSDLETRVQARTHELAQANRELRTEIAERERAEVSLYEMQARLRLALQSSNTGLWDWHLTSNEVYFSPEWKRQLGHEDLGVPNRYEEWETRLHPEDRTRTLNAVRASIENPAHGYEVEFRLRHKDGSYRWILARASLLQDAEGRAYRMLGSHTDITDRKDAETQLAQLALCDGLTGLANRRWIEEEIERALIASRRNRQKIAVMFIDLDRFKDINDTLGHEAGDSLLKRVAERLRSEVRESDAVARHGGDEFIVILIDIARPEDAANVACKLLRTLSAPMKLDGAEIAISASIGISLSPEDGSDVKTLLRHADTALYRAKEAGKNDYCFYTESFSARAHERLTIEGGLRRALERHEFLLEYQPVVAQEGLISAAEALLRWRHPKRGILAPAEFIAVAEETGLIVPIGNWVLQEARTQLLAWQRAGYKCLRVALNLSPRQLREPEFVTTVQEILAAIGDRAPSLELEITESALMANTPAVLEVLQGLKGLGMSLAIDDFGTGYASLAYLQRFPIDALKIDQSFVQNIATDPRGRATVKAIIAMARNLDLRIIAEGVETREQLALMREYGCHEYQGYFFSPAVEADAFARLMQRGSSEESAARGT